MHLMLHPVYSVGLGLFESEYAVLDKSESPQPIRWMAPEVLRGNPRTSCSDIW